MNINLTSFRKSLPYKIKNIKKFLSMTLDKTRKNLGRKKMKFKVREAFRESCN